MGDVVSSGPGMLATVPNSPGMPPARLTDRQADDARAHDRRHAAVLPYGCNLMPYRVHRRARARRAFWLRGALALLLGAVLSHAARTRDVARLQRRVAVAQARGAHQQALIAEAGRLTACASARAQARLALSRLDAQRAAPFALLAALSTGPRDRIRLTAFSYANCVARVRGQATDAATLSAWIAGLAQRLGAAAVRVVRVEHVDAPAAGSDARPAHDVHRLGFSMLMGQPGGPTGEGRLDAGADA